MVKAQDGKWVVPNPQIPRSFGLMNIIFGALTLLISVGYGVWFLYMPAFSRQMQAGIEQQEAQVQAENTKRIDELKKQEAAAKTKEEKEELKDERESLEQHKPPTITGMGDMMGMNVMKDPRVAAYYYGEVLVAIVLNVLMIVSGAGLLALTEWGRRLGVLVAQLKILRWIVMTVLTMVLVLPITMEITRKALKTAEAQIAAQGGGRGMPIPLTEFARIGTIVGAVGVILSAIVASIYPALMWWYLSRPASRVACMNRTEPEFQEPGPEWQAKV
jgi:hypothetical protein